MMIMTQSHQLQGLRKTPAQGPLYPQESLGQMYGSSGFFCIFISDSCVSVSLLIFNTNNTLIIIFYSRFYQLQLLEAWVPLAKGQKRQKSGQQNKAIIGSSPILYTQSALNAGTTISSLKS